jgi:hypothetical protein
MKDNEDDVFPVNCPCCHNRLWIDPKSRAVIKSEKAAKEKSSLDALLAQRFALTAELARKKKEEARDKFSKAFGSLDDNNNES